MGFQRSIGGSNDFPSEALYHGFLAAQNWGVKVLDAFVFFQRPSFDIITLHPPLILPLIKSLHRWHMKKTLQLSDPLFLKCYFC